MPRGHCRPTEQAGPCLPVEGATPQSSSAHLLWRGPRQTQGPHATRLHRLLVNRRHHGPVQPSGSEWLPSTLFDASLSTPEPPLGGSFFVVLVVGFALRGLVRPGPGWILGAFPRACCAVSPRSGDAADLPCLEIAPTTDLARLVRFCARWDLPRIFCSAMARRLVNSRLRRWGAVTWSMGHLRSYRVMS